MDKISGYRELTSEEVALINDAKFLGEHVAKLLTRIETAVVLDGGVKPDARALAIAKTYLQTGFMWLTRSIAKPESF